MKLHANHILLLFFVLFFPKSLEMLLILNSGPSKNRNSHGIPLVVLRYSDKVFFAHVSNTLNVSSNFTVVIRKNT